MYSSYKQTMKSSLAREFAKQTWKKVNNPQEDALRRPLTKNIKIEHMSELQNFANCISRKTLNLYKLGIFNTSVFMHKIQGKPASNINIL